MDTLIDLKLELEHSVNNIVRIARDIEKRSLTEAEIDRQAEIDRLNLEVTRLLRERNEYKTLANNLQQSVDIMNNELSEYWEVKSAFNLYGELVEQYDIILGLTSSNSFETVLDEIAWDRAKDRIRVLKNSINQIVEEIEMWRR